MGRVLTEKEESTVSKLLLNCSCFGTDAIVIALEIGVMVLPEAGVIVLQSPAANKKLAMRGLD